MRGMRPIKQVNTMRLLPTAAISTVVLILGMASRTVCAGTSEWTNVGPDGGIVSFLTVDRQDPRTVYAGTRVGAFKSVDGGKNWRNAGLMGWIVGSLVTDPQNPTTIYALAQGQSDGDLAGVFKTTDGGATWSEA